MSKDFQNWVEGLRNGRMYTKAELQAYACVDAQHRSRYWYLKVTPKARENKIYGVLELYGHVYLKVKVMAVPVAGKANVAVIELFSKALDVSKNRLRIISGQTDSLKILSCTWDTPWY